MGDGFLCNCLLLCLACVNAKDNWIVDILVLNLSGVDFGVIALEYFWDNISLR